MSIGGVGVQFSSTLVGGCVLPLVGCQKGFLDRLGLVLVLCMFEPVQWETTRSGLDVGAQEGEVLMLGGMVLGRYC